jgi:hypothetical protein
MKTIRVFPRLNEFTPDDELAFIGSPPSKLSIKRATVLVSVTFTWDKDEGKRLAKEWGKYYVDVQLGGPAFGDYAGEFIPGRFVRKGITFTSRGCIRKCPWCYIWKREGYIRELKIKTGYHVEDANFLACSKQHILKTFGMLKNQSETPTFSALDARLFEEWHLKLLEDIGVKELCFASDYFGGENHLKRIYPLLSDKPREWRSCCVLVGNDTLGRAIEKVNRVKDAGFEPAVMLYQTDRFRHYGKKWLEFQKLYPRYLCLPEEENK